MTNTSNPIGKGISNTTFAKFNYYSSAGYTLCVYYRFNLSEIPNDAVIEDVSCVAKIGLSSVSSVTKKTVSLCYGTKTTKSSVTLNSGTANYTLSGGSWTRDELKDARLCISVTHSGSSTSRYASFYGADLTVTYTYQSEKFMLKLGGAWHDIARVFKKVSGIWVEQTDLANVIEDGVRYQNGGEYVPPNPVVNIVGTGNSSNCYVTINGVKYTSGAKVSVEPGTVITLVMKGSSDSLPGAVFVDDGSQPVQYGTSVTYNHTVTNNSVIQFVYYVSGSAYSGVAYVITGVDTNVSSFFIVRNDFTYAFAFRTGMTWAEFCGSRYNIVFGGTVSGNQIVFSDGSYIADVKPTDAIVAGKTYTRTGL